MYQFHVGLGLTNKITGQPGGRCAFWEEGGYRTCRRRACGPDSWVVSVAGSREGHTATDIIYFYHLAGVSEGCTGVGRRHFS